MKKFKGQVISVLENDVSIKKFNSKSIYEIEIRDQAFCVGDFVNVTTEENGEVNITKI